MIMPWIREGECNQCGRCCLVEMQYKPMLDKKGVCIYLAKDGNKYICLITAGKFTTDIEKGPDIPQEHYDYWKEECLPYPDPKSDAHVPPAHKLLDGCGFRLVRVDG